MTTRVTNVMPEADAVRERARQVEELLLACEERFDRTAEPMFTFEPSSWPKRYSYPVIAEVATRLRRKFKVSGLANEGGFTVSKIEVMQNLAEVVKDPALLQRLLALGVRGVFVGRDWEFLLPSGSSEELRNQVHDLVFRELFQKGICQGFGVFS